jgi:hypothetical protein
MGNMRHPTKERPIGDFLAQQRETAIESANPLSNIQYAAITLARNLVVQEG